MPSSPQELHIQTAKCKRRAIFPPSEYNTKQANTRADSMTQTNTRLHEGVYRYPLALSQQCQQNTPDAMLCYAMLQVTWHAWPAQLVISPPLHLPFLHHRLS